jgi:hypothetical protein
MILDEGGSQAWALSPANARRCKYIVCTRNRYFPDAKAEVQAAAQEEHGTAFLVGRITTVEPSPERNDRFIIRFDEYAILDPAPVVWPGARNPVWYVEDIRELGIDPNVVDWRPMPRSELKDDHISPAAADTAEGNPEGLTFDQARAGLAITYRVAPAAIEIVIRG